jgi:hypothetical protein
MAPRFLTILTGRYRCARGLKSRPFVLAISAFITSAVVHAQSMEQPCILAATKYLPRTPGIEVVEIRTKPLPPDVEAKLGKGAFHILVEIDAKSGRQHATFEFFCVAGVGGDAHVSRLK